jgi:alanine racemase
MSAPEREARINLGAITANVATLKHSATPAVLMAVVKANGYGHGAVESARAALAGGADWLGVVDSVEAFQLRDAGITAPLLTWMHGPRANFEKSIAAGIDLGVSTLEQLDQVAAASAGSSGVGFVHLKIDTGLGRNGIADDKCAEVFDRAAAYERAGRLRVRGLFSHLSNAGADEDAVQISRFEVQAAAAKAAGLTINLHHLSATEATLVRPAARFDMVRVGLGIYGLSPFPGTTAKELGLRPAMELRAPIVNVKRVPAGTGISYGFTYRTTEPSTLALIPLGYADGVPRAASSRGPVSINGRQYRVSGRIAMDQFVVDLGADTAAIGDTAVLFGDPETGVPAADDWAIAADTINYEIVTRVGHRVTRTYES